VIPGHAVAGDAVLASLVESFIASGLSPLDADAAARAAIS